MLNLQWQLHLSPMLVLICGCTMSMCGLGPLIWEAHVFEIGVVTQLVNGLSWPRCPGHWVEAICASRMVLTRGNRPIDASNTFKDIDGLKVSFSRIVPIDPMTKPASVAKQGSSLPVRFNHPLCLNFPACFNSR